MGCACKQSSLREGRSPLSASSPATGPPARLSGEANGKEGSWRDRGPWTVARPRLRHATGEPAGQDPAAARRGVEVEVEVEKAIRAGGVRAASGGSRDGESFAVCGLSWVATCMRVPGFLRPRPRAFLVLAIERGRRSAPQRAESQPWLRCLCSPPPPACRYAARERRSHTRRTRSPTLEITRRLACGVDEGVDLPRRSLPRDASLHGLSGV